MPDNTFESFYNFLYTGKIDISMETIEDILTLSTEYKIHTLKRACREAAEELLEKKTCFKLYSLAS